MTTVVANPDGPLVLARRQLADAVHAIVDPQPTRVSDRYHWEPPVYVALRRELFGGRPERRDGTALRRSRDPVRIAVLQWLLDVDRAVIGWTPEEKGGTVERLHAIAAYSWRPQDVATIERIVDDLRRWTISGTELLVPPVQVYLPLDCPRCAARHAYHRNSYGESVSSAALRVSETGCVCLNCGAFWPPSEFGWLARLLGLNRPGMSGDSISWKGWSHVRWFIEEVSAGAA